MRALILVCALLGGCALCTPHTKLPPTVIRPAPVKPNVKGDPEAPWGPNGPPVWEDTCFPTWPSQPCQHST